MEDLCLQYYDDYVALGITPWFKVYNATDWKGLNGT